MIKIRNVFFDFPSQVSRTLKLNFFLLLFLFTSPSTLFQVWSLYFSTCEDSNHCQRWTSLIFVQPCSQKCGSFLQLLSLADISAFSSAFKFTRIVKMLIFSSTQLIIYKFAAGIHFFSPSSIYLPFLCLNLYNIYLSANGVPHRRRNNLCYDF